tara:strand:- start:755 stop:1246 length:492 start_codon:yes stop_codon:yes gene_type:complete
MAKNSAFRVIVEPTQVDGTGNTLVVIDNRSGDQPMRIDKMSYSVDFAFTGANLALNFRLYKTTSSGSSLTAGAPANGVVATRRTPYETTTNTGDTQAVIYKLLTTPITAYTVDNDELIDSEMIGSRDIKRGVIGGCIVQVGEAVILRCDGDPATAIVVIEGID